jgi:hypothetical protein
MIIFKPMAAAKYELYDLSSFKEILKMKEKN